MKFLAKIIFVAVALSLLSSCAFLFNKKTVALTINSNPQGADIIIEGKNYGKTPATINIEPQNYTALLTKEGYGSAQLKLETWSSIREGADGARCLGDAVSVIFFFDIYSKYCTDFKEKNYNVAIPYIGVAKDSAAYSGAGGNGQQNNAGGYYYQSKDYYKPYGYSPPQQSLRQ